MHITTCRTGRHLLLIHLNRPVGHYAAEADIITIHRKKLSNIAIEQMLQVLAILEAVGCQVWLALAAGAIHRPSVLDEVWKLVENGMIILYC